MVSWTSSFNNGIYFMVFWTSSFNNGIYFMVFWTSSFNNGIVFHVVIVSLWKLISSARPLTHYRLPPLTQFVNKLYLLILCFTRSAVTYVYASLPNNNSTTAGTYQAMSTYFTAFHCDIQYNCLSSILIYFSFTQTRATNRTFISFPLWDTVREVSWHCVSLSFNLQNAFATLTKPATAAASQATAVANATCLPSTDIS
jgi:hypothetical protein